ncbi:MAG TPA: lysylphosphatidylglycerol synthase domain-containing protein [Candidatus Saccharimonadales bacterium]
MKNRLHIAISISLLLIAVIVFGVYISKHSYLLDKLKNISPYIVFWLLLLYSLWFISLSLIIKYCLRICNISIPTDENILLNAYSTIVNFFVPGQGGPAVRGAYLYKKHKLKIRLYIFVTLIYYLIYGIVNSFLAFSASSLWWILIPLIIIISTVGIFGGRKYISKFKINKGELSLTPTNLCYLLAATIFQILIIVTINLVELHSVNSGISIKQVAIYTGVANLSIFVALTPGAIGIREGFLIFSRKLHHISVTNIISASIIDRSIFLVVLAILLIYILATHAKTKLFTSKTNP